MPEPLIDEDDSSSEGESTHAGTEADGWPELGKALERLFRAVASQGRDLKLADALLRTIIEIISEAGADALLPEESTNPADPRTSEEAQTKPRKSRMRPEYRDRIEAVVDSWSDDEAAGYLAIGLRQLQRRAHQGELYFFIVNRKRRYPVWQFDYRLGLIGGISEVSAVFPKDWRPEQTYRFMTTQAPGLRHLSPAQWLLGGHDPREIAEILGRATEDDSAP